MINNSKLYDLNIEKEEKVAKIEEEYARLKQELILDFLPCKKGDFLEVNIAFKFYGYMTKVDEDGYIEIDETTKDKELLNNIRYIPYTYCEKINILEKGKANV
jgi:hypothetical protein